MLPPIASPVAEQAVAQMDAGQLSAIVSRLFKAPVTVTGWAVSLLGGLDSSPMAGGVYKVMGTACPERLTKVEPVEAAVTPTDPNCEWAVVVKILRSPEGWVMPDGTAVTREMAENQRHFGYWQREAIAAEAGLLDSLPAGLYAPRCLGVTSISDTECWLWQEYLPADDPWTMADYRAAAYRLGQWQAVPPKLPDHPWLCRNWMNGWVHGPLSSIFGLVEGMNGYEHPLLTAHFALEELDALRQLWADRQCYLDRLARLPKTVCHLDAHRGNLRWQHGDLALLDWAFVGEGALGEELAAFIGATLLLDDVPLTEAERLEEAAFAGYLAGLREAGWTGNEADIWEAYRCAMPLRYAPASLASMLRTVIQPEFAADWERKTGKPLADILAHRAGLVRFYLSRLPDGEEIVE